MPQACQDPAPDDLNADFDPRFREGRFLALSRGLRARWNDGGAVMPRQVVVEPAPAKAGVRLTVGSWKQGLVIPALRLSLTLRRATPPKYIVNRFANSIGVMNSPSITWMPK